MDYIKGLERIIKEHVDSLVNEDYDESPYKSSRSLGTVDKGRNRRINQMSYDDAQDRRAQEKYKKDNPSTTKPTKEIVEDDHPNNGKKPGDVWQTPTKKWAGMNKDHKFDYFDDQESAKAFANGTQSKADAKAHKQGKSVDKWSGRRDRWDAHKSKTQSYVDRTAAAVTAKPDQFPDSHPGENPETQANRKAAEKENPEYMKQFYASQNKPTNKIRQHYTSKQADQLDRLTKEFENLPDKNTQMDYERIARVVYDTLNQKGFDFDQSLQYIANRAQHATNPKDKRTLGMTLGWLWGEFGGYTGEKSWNTRLTDPKNQGSQKIPDDTKVPDLSANDDDDMPYGDDYKYDDRNPEFDD